MSTRQGIVCRAAGALALLCALVGVSGEVRAQVPASDPDLLTSRPPDLLIAEGHKLYDAGRYKEAAASFERAMQLGVARPHEAARNVARSYAKLGNRKQAVRWAEIAELLEHPDVAMNSDAARALPSLVLTRPTGHAILIPGAGPWRAQPRRTPTAKFRSSGSSTTSTT